MKKNRIILLILSFLQGMVFYASISILYRQKANLSLTEIGLIESIYYLFSLLFEIPWGIFADRFGYKKTMIFCNGLYFLSKIVFYQANSFLSFLFERFLLSMALAGISGVDSAMLYLSCEKGESQKVFGIYYNLGSIGMMSSSLIYSCFFKGNYRLAALMTCIPFGCAWILSFFLNEVSHEIVNHSFHDLFEMIKEIFKDRNILFILIGGALLTEIIHELTAFLNQVLYIEAHISDHFFGLIHVFMTGIGFLSVLSYSLTEKMGRKGFLYSLMGLICLSCYSLVQFKISWICIISIAILEFVNAVFFPLFQTLQNERVKVIHRATQLSVFMIFMELIQMIIDASIFRIAEYSINLAVIFGLFLCVFGSICLIKNIN